MTTASPFFLDNEYLVVDKVVGLVSVKFYAAEIVDVYFAFSEHDPFGIRSCS
jgi:hypothetical protein